MHDLELHVTLCYITLKPTFSLISRVTAARLSAMFLVQVGHMSVNREAVKLSSTVYVLDNKQDRTDRVHFVLCDHELNFRMVVM